MERMRRWLSLALVLVLVLSYVPANVFAAEDKVTSCLANGDTPSHSFNDNGFCTVCDTGYQEPEGSGTSADPYKIANGGNLYWFAQAVDNGNKDAWAVLTADITISPLISGEKRQWNPIGQGEPGRENYSPYGGTLDSQNHSITGLYYEGYESGYIGLVARTSDTGVIKNLQVWDSTFRTYNWYVGGIVGESFGTVENCSFQGTVTGDNAYGGIAGKISNSKISNCWTSMGRLYGMDDGSTVTNSYSLYQTGDATGVYAYRLGGAWGQNIDNGGTEQVWPMLGGAKVYYGYPNCTAKNAVYTNNADVNENPGVHRWVYTASGAEITGACAYNCGTDGGKVTLTLDGSAVYDGSEKTVTAEGTLSGIDTLPKVICEGDQVNAGDFTASLTLEDGTKAELKVTIKPATVTVTSVTVAERTYDGTTEAEVTKVLYSGVVPGEDVAVTAAAAFDSAGSGENKTVNLTYELTGKDKENYVLAQTTGTTTASILPMDVEQIVKPLEGVTPGNVTSDNLGAIRDVREALGKAKKDPGLTDEQKKNIDDALADLDKLEKTVYDAWRAVEEESVEDTLDVTGENVTLEDRENLEKAKDVLEDALENFGSNYTEEEKGIIRENIGRIEDALDVLNKVEEVEKLVKALPETVEPDDEKTTAAIQKAKDAYDALADREKEMVSGKAKEKLDKLLEATTAYKVIKGDGASWSKGSETTLDITANGPYGKFTGIEIDGKTVDTALYTSASGSTIIMLKASYLEGMTVGSHTIEILYTDGAAAGSFSIAPAPATGNSPATGDSGQVALWSSIALISLAAAAALVLGKKRFTV